MARKALIQFRRDTAANWTSADPVLAAGELGWESDTNKVKIGDGATAWNSLGYLSTGSGSSPLTTKGDLYGHNATVDARIPVGSDGQILKADSTKANGIAWADATAGGAVVGSDGWVDDTAETWSYASGSGGGKATFTVPGDKTAKYTVGTRIKLTQTIAKYFVVAAAPTYGGTNTTVTILGGSDYTLANAAITSNYHSYVANPQGYPGWFNFDFGVTGFSSTTFNTARFAVNGRVCTIAFYVNGTSNATTSVGTLPIPTANTFHNLDYIIRVANVGTFASGLANLAPATSNTAVNFFPSAAAAAFSASGTKVLTGTFAYEI